MPATVLFPLPHVPVKTNTLQFCVMNRPDLCWLAERAGNSGRGGNQRVRESGPAKALFEGILLRSLRAPIAPTGESPEALTRQAKKAQTRCDSLFRARVVTGMVFVRTLKLASPSRIRNEYTLVTSVPRFITPSRRDSSPFGRRFDGRDGWERFPARRPLLKRVPPGATTPRYAPAVRPRGDVAGSSRAYGRSAAAPAG